MSKSKIGKRLAALIAAFLLVLNLSGIVWADPETEEPVPEEPATVEEVPVEEVTVEVTEEVPEVIEEVPYEPENPVSFGLEASGNMELQDDISGEQAQDIEFITVNTRDGHTFYIVIERYQEGDNVHFLNQVDSYDLQAILSEGSESTEILDETYETDLFESLIPTEPVPTGTDIPEDETDGQKTDLKKNLYTFGAVVLLIGAVAGAYYVVKIRPNKKGKIDEDHEFTDDEEYEAEDPDEFEEVEDGAESVPEEEPEEYEDEYEED
jgi:hypothetical protein